MKNEEKQPDRLGKKHAAVCGLYCGACSLFIATREDPERLTRLAARFGFSEEAVTCHGCRSEKRFPHCENCRMFTCVAERGIDFCSECAEYPCGHLKEFQAERPHRMELWDDLERIRTIGHDQWLREIREHYSCPRCGTINSAYDLKCRKCGEEPSCAYVARHREAISQFLAKL
ncbi:MAG: hypothetical protein FD174_2891 [Geobacteraceae bacterium]|nr:MAG: hypothetical protein FD174_2891 [Geobacteraceae bacterium]